MTGFCTFTSAIFHAYHHLRPSDRGEFEISNAADLLVKSGRMIHTVRLAR